MLYLYSQDGTAEHRGTLEMQQQTAVRSASPPSWVGQQGAASGAVTPLKEKNSARTPEAGECRATPQPCDQCAAMASCHQSCGTTQAGLDWQESAATSRRSTATQSSDTSTPEAMRMQVDMRRHTSTAWQTALRPSWRPRGRSCSPNSRLKGEWGGWACSRSGSQSLLARLLRDGPACRDKADADRTLLELCLAEARENNAELRASLNAAKCVSSASSCT